MPMLLGTKGNEILKWRVTAGLAATLKTRMADKWGCSSARQAESFLGQYIGALKAELSYEEQFLSETSTLDEAIAEANLDELQPLRTRYREVAAAYFRRRQSVLALCESCNKLHDRLLDRALSMAQARMQQPGQGDPPLHALLVSGDRGRGEETLLSENRYFLLYEEQNPSSWQFSRQLITALGQTGLLGAEPMFWHGSLEEWRALLGGSFPLPETEEQHCVLSPLPPFAAPQKQGSHEMPDWAWRLEALADLSFTQGDASLASEALNTATVTLQNERNRGPFLQLARRVIGLPLAVGRFGGWRLERNGEHRGELNLEELALAPLLMTVRILSVHVGIHTAGTVNRIKELLEKGALDVDLAERLLKAFQCFMRLKILSEIRSEESGAFCNPEEFDEEEEVRFRSSLEAVLHLQKIAYQRMVGQG